MPSSHDVHGKRLATFRLVTDPGAGADLPRLVACDWFINAGRASMGDRAPSQDASRRMATPRAIRRRVARGHRAGAWFADSHERSWRRLASAPADLETWTFLEAPTLTFWARRQAHETAIHRVDAESLWGCHRFPSGFAVDGIDELLPLREPARPNNAGGRDDTVVMAREG